MPYRDLEKRREYQRNYQKNNRKILYAKQRERHSRQKEFIRKLKDVPCADCGLRYPHYVMDFDHITGEKKYNLSRLMKVTASWKTIKEEVAKCEIVCSNCHRIRSWKRLYDSPLIP
jgi:hypothetical protein